MTRRKSSSEQVDASPPSFEEALGGLEAVIEAMEHEHLALEDLVMHYEKGSALLSHCESILQSARERIELITLRNHNEIGLDTNSKTATPADLSDDSDDDNDIRLF